MSRSRLLGWIKAFYVVLLLAAASRYVWRVDVEPAVWASWLKKPGPYVFMVGWATMACTLGYAWAQVLRMHLGLRLVARDWLPLQALAWLGRYLPGKLGLLAGKLGLVTRHGVTVRALGFTVLYEQLAFVAAGLALTASMPAFVFGLQGAAARFWEDATVWRFLLAIALSVLIVPVMRALRSSAGLRGHVEYRQEWRVPALHLLAHAIAGTGLFICLRSLPGMEESGPALLYVIGLLAAANVAGILALFAPAGLGVREGVLIAGLVPWLPIQDAVIVATLLRILSVMADLGFSAIAGLISCQPRGLK